METNPNKFLLKGHPLFDLKADIDLSKPIKFSMVTDYGVVEYESRPGNEYFINRKKVHPLEFKLAIQAIKDKK